MSLTSELGRRGSPVRGYLESVAPLVAGVNRRSPFCSMCISALGLGSLTRSPTVNLSPESHARGAASILGAAFDYRVRFLFRPDPSHRFVAKKAYLFASKLEAKVLDSFFNNLDSYVEEVLRQEKVLSVSEEMVLSRYCLVLAQLDAVYRSGGVVSIPAPTPARQRSGWQYEPLLALPSDSLVKDLVALASSAQRTLEPLVSLARSGALPYHPNPGFVGSAPIGGADADFILDECLFEVKTTSLMTNGTVREALLQAIGYCLLDSDDRHGLRNVALYFGRHEWVKMWPLWSLIFPPAFAIKWSEARHEPDEADVKSRLDQLRDVMRRVVDGEQVDLEEALLLQQPAPRLISTIWS